MTRVTVEKRSGLMPIWVASKWEMCSETENWSQGSIYRFLGSLNSILKKYFAFNPSECYQMGSYQITNIYSNKEHLFFNRLNFWLQISNLNWFGKISIIFTEVLHILLWSSKAIKMLYPSIFFSNNSLLNKCRGVLRSMYVISF